MKENKEQLLKKYTKADDMAKEQIQTELENITFDISKILKEIQTCRRIINNTERGDKEQKLIEQREKENLKYSEKDGKNNDNKLRF